MLPPDLPLPAFADRWTPATRASAARLLDRMLGIARRQDAHPMLEGGTLLGQVRHDGHLIPWDDDVDLIVDDRAFDPWMRALDDDDSLGVARLHHRRYGRFAKVWWRHDAAGVDASASRARHWPFVGALRNFGVDIGKRGTWNWPFVDVFRYVDDGAALVSCPEGTTRRSFANDEMLPPRQADFEGVPVLIPRNADRVLDAVFPNWRTDFDSGAWDHRRETRRLRRVRYAWNPAGAAKGNASRIVYTDMCADLFHAGHVHFLRQARALGDRLVVGVHDDATIASYKRPPVQTLAERLTAVAACRHVDQVVPGAPLVVTPRYLDALGAHVVCHADDLTPAARDHMYGAILASHGVELVPYTPGISSQALVERVLARERGDELQLDRPPASSGGSCQ